MNIQHINIKFFVAQPDSIDLADYITIFNEWIQDQVCEELLVDVADYRHVHAGPEVLLVGHEANYSMDNTDNRIGLLYNRKAPVEGGNQNRIRQAIQAALHACLRLERHGSQQGRLSFSGREFRLWINDRLIAPNTSETPGAFEPELRGILDNMYGPGAYTMEHASPDLRERFSIRVTAHASARISDLIETVERTMLA